MHNRRSHPRLHLRESIKVRLQGILVEGAECYNISLRGMCLVFHGPYPHARTGRLWLTRNCGGTAIQVEADFKIMWEQPGTTRLSERRMGVHFEELSPLQRDNIWRIVEFESKHSPTPSDQ